MAVSSTPVVRRCSAASRLAAVFVLAVVALLVTTGRLYAGTITITDGVHNPGSGLYSDEVIASLLVTGPVPTTSASKRGW